MPACINLPQAREEQSSLVPHARVVRLRRRVLSTYYFVFVVSKAPPRPFRRTSKVFYCGTTFRRPSVCRPVYSYHVMLRTKHCCCCCCSIIVILVSHPHCIYLLSLAVIRRVISYQHVCVMCIAVLFGTGCCVCYLAPPCRSIFTEARRKQQTPTLGPSITHTQDSPSLFLYPRPHNQLIFFCGACLRISANTTPSSNNTHCIAYYLRVSIACRCRQIISTAYEVLLLFSSLATRNAHQLCCRYF